ncbi:Oxidoreductase, zinc-binding dehydrogenase family [Verrucomicrobia bacterium]|nr:Oxidoreductase, zinc-binding dehydrogenase family [Verrucomicrobiota bacterium]
MTTGVKAWLLDEFKGIEHLRLSEVPEPTPQRDEVVVQLRYAALNPADRYLAEGQYPAKPPLPHILGRDGMGMVAQTGPGVAQVRVGDRRAILRGAVGVERAGTFAERVVVPVQDLVEVPAAWSEEESAGATLVYLTAYQALTQWGTLALGSVVLVTGASGGVGVATVQLAAAMGHTVLGLSRNAEKGRRVRELGATAVFNPEDTLWRQSVKVALAPRPVDLAIDNIGGKLFPQVLETLGEQGKVSVVGRLAGPVPEFNTAALLFRRLRIGGVAVGAYTNTESRAAWQQVLALLASRGARPLVDRVFGFEQLPQAFERLAQGPMGKVVVKI